MPEAVRGKKGKETEADSSVRVRETTFGKQDK
jgi:hypothetical protein